MKQLWAPWRGEYLQQDPKTDRCIFCEAAGGTDDRAALVVARGQHCFVLMNRFPYNSGHVMVVPTRHSGNLHDLDDGELAEMFRYIDYSARVAKRALRAEGFNLGMNLGRAAGAGIVDHLHVHVVPRWVGDTNFMPVLSEVKVISEHLQTTYQKLADGFAIMLAEVQPRGA
ncbi:MAG: HIT family hydrolase [Armatimonadetes bacterium 13_1_40CM_64_14]|nr:MAG: HIT family hydrolase [Armatimonadetes bacterium 13_1_40CM_64_14]